jgi:hypothetical protein
MTVTVLILSMPRSMQWRRGVQRLLPLEGQTGEPTWDIWTVAYVDPMKYSIYSLI